jgi:hypothetical protein
MATLRGICGGCGLAHMGIHPMNAQLTLDDDGTGIEGVCCLACKDDGRSTFGFAYPVRPYVIALACGGCGEPLVEFDQFTGIVA